MTASARDRVHAMFPLDAMAEQELNARLDAYRTEVLAEAADDLGQRIRLGGPTARGLAYARSLLTARANSTDPETPRRQANHAEAAAKLRAQPGAWLPVADYVSKGSAISIGRHIRHAFLAAYAPARTFETRVEQAPDGFRVVARFVGTTTEDTTS